MKPLFVAVVALISLSAGSLVAQSSSGATLDVTSNYTSGNTGTLTIDLTQQNSVPPIAVGTPALGGQLICNFVTGTPSYGGQYQYVQYPMTGSYSTVVVVGGNVFADGPLLRGRIIVTGDAVIEDVICPSNIIARREDVGTTIHLKKGDGGVISLEVPSDPSNPSSAEWRLSNVQQLLPLQGSDSHNGTISIVGVDGNAMKVPDKSDSIKPIDIFKLTDETTGVISYNFSYVATALGTTSLTFVLVETSADGDILKDTAFFTIQVDDTDSSSPSSVSNP